MTLHEGQGLALLSPADAETYPVAPYCREILATCCSTFLPGFQ